MRHDRARLAACGVSVGDVGTAQLEQRLSDRKARAGVSASIGVLFAFVAGASFGGVLPSQLRLLAGGLALAGFVAAALFTGEARGVEAQLSQLKAQRELAALDERLLVPVVPVADVDATLIGVDKAVQEILPGGALPRYLARDVDEALRAAFAAALDGRGPWIVVAVGMSKAGKSRALLKRWSTARAARRSISSRRVTVTRCARC